jgi:uncharacterized protein
MEILAAALLHDVDDLKYFDHPKDDKYGNAKLILQEAQVNPSSWDAILLMIDSVSSCSSSNGNSVPKTIKESKEYFRLIPRWDDRVEAVGAKGVLRCYQYNQELGRPFCRLLHHVLHAPNA